MRAEDVAASLDGVEDLPSCEAAHIEHHWSSWTPNSAAPYRICATCGHMELLT